MLPERDRRQRSITEALTAFCDAEQYGPPEVWAYDPAATTAELQEALGGALPAGWPEDCHSLQAQAVALGSPTLPAMPTDPDDVRLGRTVGAGYVDVSHQLCGCPTGASAHC